MWNERTVWLESLGCAKNQVDAEVMLSVLLDHGWTRAEAPEAAELILVNSCGFIKPAKEESIQVSLGLAGLPAKVVMTGCLSQRYAEQLASEMPELAGFFGNREPAAILDYLEKELPAGHRALRPHTTAPVVLDTKAVQKIDNELPAYTVPRRQVLLGHPGSAYVKVSEGCKNRCTFCAIPLIRGDLRSRSEDEVVKEVEDLLARGIREIILIAQDLNAFGHDRGKKGLQPLLRRLAAIPGQFWIRPLYVYPDTFELDMLDLFEKDQRFVPYFDIPFQHGSKTVIQAMGRRGSPEEYLDLIRAIRSRVPQAAIRTSMLVGFPGESDEDFASLMAFQREAALEWLGVFSYSAEEGTLAARMKGKIPQKVARARQAEVEGQQIAITAARLDRYVGLVTEVLVEEAVAGEDLCIGRTFFQAPEVDGLTVLHTQGRDYPPGSFVKARLIKRNGVDMEAWPLSSGA